MILTEADLHAYNAGELSPEAVRVLEDDPLAVQDAARLRALSAAIRQEAPIPVTGRAETIARLRASARPRIGIPGLVWAFGATAVVVLVVLTIPRERPAEYAVRPASYVHESKAESALGSGALQKQGEAQSSPMGAAREAPMSDAATSIAAAPTIARDRAVEPIEFRASNRTEALRLLRTALTKVGGTHSERASGTSGVDLRTFRVRIPTSEYAVFVEALSGSRSDRARSQGATAQSRVARPQTPEPMRLLQVRWVPSR